MYIFINRGIQYGKRNFENILMGRIFQESVRMRENVEILLVFLSIFS